MYIVCIYCLLSILVPFQTIMASTPNDFWQEYRAAKKSRAVQNPVEHIKNLSTRLDSDTSERLESKKTAILWFMATGGKNGFRNTSATPAERLVLENALIFATIVHDVNYSEKFLQIIAVRREVGITTEDAKIRTHLLHAQRIITATRIMLQSAMSLKKLEPYVKELFNKEYIGMVFHSRNTKSMSLTEWQQEARKFADVFTGDIDSRAKEVFSDNLEFSFNDPGACLGFKKPITETSVSTFRRFIVESCTPDQRLFPSAPERKLPSSAATGPYRPFYVVTANGSTITRNANGSVSVEIGNLTMEAGGGGVSYGALQINKTQTEEEFLAAINAFSAIIEKTYI